MKYGDAVRYVHNGVLVEALVAQSRAISKDQEHLTLLYLDPEQESSNLTGTQLERCLVRAFDVPPLVEGAKFGWMGPQEPPPQPEQPAQPELTHEEKEALIEAASAPLP